MKRVIIIFIFLFSGIIYSQGKANLIWSPPLVNADGAPLTNLAGYKVYWGSSPGNYQYVVDVKDTTAYDISWVVGLRFFSVTAYNTFGYESDYSEEVYYAGLQQSVAKPLPAKLRIEPFVDILDTLIIRKGESFTLFYEIEPKRDDGTFFSESEIDSVGFHLKDTTGVWSTPVVWSHNDTSEVFILLFPGIYKIGLTYWVSGVESDGVDKYYLDVRDFIIIRSKKLFNIW